MALLPPASATAEHVRNGHPPRAAVEQNDSLNVQKHLLRWQPSKSRKGSQDAGKLLQPRTISTPSHMNKNITQLSKLPLASGC
jgi:hypothetical protein